jgi:hypothetical protein
VRRLRVDQIGVNAKGEWKPAGQTSEPVKKRDQVDINCDRTFRLLAYFSFPLFPSVVRRMLLYIGLGGGGGCMVCILVIH